jgi:protein-S-isoprenylcysteine O-methyltransferase Ste14
MAKTPKAADFRMMSYIGLLDVVLGLALVVVGFTGVLEAGPEIMTPTGLLVSAMGVALALWARNKMAQAERQGGDRN